MSYIIYYFFSENLIFRSKNILMPTHKSSDYKLSVVKYYLSHSKNQVQTCKIFGCSERNLMRWVDKYKSTNNITRKKRDYSAYKITNNHISFIKQQLKQNKTITMDELLSKLKINFVFTILFPINIYFLLSIDKPRKFFRNIFLGL